MINRELFARDPVSNSIPNDGVAKIGEPETNADWEVLRYELSSFVCEGEYERGLEKILDTYIKNLDHPVQPAAWVSGFYGSGKSHLVRVLEFLWRDVTFPDGATARGLVDLPQGIEDMLRELDTAGKRGGGRWSAAGTLGSGAGESVRLSILGVLLRSAGLPGRYAQGRFVLWLMQSGIYEEIKAAVEREGRDLRAELQNLYVSPYLARALLEAYPAFADSEKEVRGLIKAQYPSPEDISDEEMLEAISALLSLKSEDPDDTPCTLLVLDELQQYIGDNADRTLRVQNVVEACSARFGGRLMFVATGQSALQATPQLQKLQGRFTVRVALSDTDVEEVVRKVVLRKDQSKRGELQSVLEETSGEIDRQLAGTRVGPAGSDGEVLLADYPLLPVRRRFWERVLRAIDRAGAAGQLRTQLRIVQDATEEVAGREVGNVVAADFVYDQLSPGMLQTGVLLKEVDETIRGQRDGTEEGELRSRLCALIFLIAQLPRDAGSDTGVRATAEMLADLMVEDLRAGGATLRRRIPELLQQMVDNGQLMLVEGEYRLQTREGAEWTAAYQGARARLIGDDARMASDRSRELREAASRALKGLSFTHGESKTPRKTELHFGSDAPRADTGAVPVWVRDEWNATERTVIEEARAAGPESPVVHVFLPRRGSEELKGALAAYEAAAEVISGRPVPTTQEGQEACAAMEQRKNAARASLDSVVDSVLRNARVMLGGGTETSGGLREAVEEAGWAALERLYPRFAEADHARWPTVLRNVRDGSGDPLSALGYKGDAEKHPACAEILNAVGPGKKGGELRGTFESPPYGWPRDAVDGALLTLLSASLVKASVNGSPVAARELDQARISKAEFRAETSRVTAQQRLQVRKLFAEAGVQWRSDEESKAGRQLMDAMIALAEKAGGDPPLPPQPGTGHLRELRDLDGNALVLGLYERLVQLRGELSEWEERREEARERLADWKRLQSLLDHAAGPDHLDGAGRLQEQAAAIKRDRTLLEEPDPVPPLLTGATDLLRGAVTEAHERYEREFAEGMRRLEESETWRSLPEEKRQSILRSASLAEADKPKVEDAAALLDSLNHTSLASWHNLADALQARFERAAQEAARELEPKAVRVSVKGASLNTEEEVDEYLKELRGRIMSRIEEGRPVIL
jgi:hypothetical protein